MSPSLREEIIMALPNNRDQDKTRFSVIKPPEKSYKKGELIFIEENSQVLYFLRAGKLKLIPRNSTAETVIVEPNGIVGTLSFLREKLPYSSAQVIEDSRVFIIDDGLFKNTLKLIPEWLANIILLVVSNYSSRLQKINLKKVTQYINNIIEIVLLLDHSSESYIDGKRVVDSATLKKECKNLLAISFNEVNEGISYLQQKSLLINHTNSEGIEFWEVANREVLELFDKYLTAEKEGKEIHAAAPLNEDEYRFVEAIGSYGKEHHKTNIHFSELPEIEGLSDKSDSYFNEVVNKLKEYNLCDIIDYSGELVIQFDFILLNEVTLFKSWNKLFQKKVTV